MKLPTSPDRTRIAAHAVVSPRTVDRCYAGARTQSTTRARIESAARELGFASPPCAESTNTSTTSA